MLFLVKYYQAPGYVDGAVYIGLIEAESETEAEVAAAKRFVSKRELEEYEPDEDESDEWNAAQKKKHDKINERLKKQIEEQYKEELEKACKRVSVVPVGGMMCIWTIKTTYSDY